MRLDFAMRGLGIDMAAPDEGSAWYFQGYGPAWVRLKPASHVTVFSLARRYVSVPTCNENQVQEAIVRAPAWLFRKIAKGPVFRGTH